MVGGGDDKDDVDDEGGWYSTVYVTAIYLKLNDAAIDATSSATAAVWLRER